MRIKTRIAIAALALICPIAANAEIRLIGGGAWSADFGTAALLAQQAARDKCISLGGTQIGASSVYDWDQAGIVWHVIGVVNCDIP